MKSVLYCFSLFLISVYTSSLPAAEFSQVKQQDFKKAELELNTLITQAQLTEQPVLELQMQKANLYMLFNRSDLLGPLLAQLESPTFFQGSLVLKSRWYLNTAFKNYLLGHYSDAEKDFTSALHALSQIPADSELVSTESLAYLENEAQMYRALNLVYLQNYQESVKVLISVYKLAKQKEWWSMAGQSLLFMGDLNYSLKNYEEAQEHYQAAYDAYPKEDVLYLAQAKMAIGQMINIIGDKQVALSMIDEVIQSYQQLNNQIGLAEAFLLKSYFLGSQGKNAEALVWIESAVGIQVMMGNPVDIANVYVHYSSVLSKNNQLDKAVLYARKAVELADLGDDLSGKWDAYGNFSLLLGEQDQYEEAFKYMRLAERALLAKARLDITSEMAKLNLEFNLSNQKLENKFLDQQKQLLEERNSLLNHQLVMEQLNQKRQSWAMGLMLIVILLFIVFLAVIYRLYRINKKLANYDSLTKMHNRRSILALGEREFITSKRYDYPLSVLMLDIDNFKQINDQHGHSAGDKVLKHVAALCANMARKCDYVGRIGGEEFLMIFPHTSEESSVLLAERLCELVKNQQQSEVKQLQQVTMSIGLCAKTAESASLSELIIQADTALYTAKNRGRNQVQVFNHSGASNDGDNTTYASA